MNATFFLQFVILGANQKRSHIPSLAVCGVSGRKQDVEETGFEVVEKELFDDTYGR